MEHDRPLLAMSEPLLSSGLEGLAELKPQQFLSRDDERLGDVPVPDRTQQWLVVRHESIEAVRKKRLGAASTLLLVPNIAKTPITPGEPALDKADAKAKIRWTKPPAGEGRNNLVVPICIDAPWKDLGL